MFGHVRILSSKRGPDEHRWSQVRILPTVLILFLLFGSSLYLLVLLCCNFHLVQKFFLLVFVFRPLLPLSCYTLFALCLRCIVLGFLDRIFGVALSTFVFYTFRLRQALPILMESMLVITSFFHLQKKQYFLVRLLCRFIISHLLIPLSVKQTTPFFVRNEKSLIVALNTT